MSINIVSYKFSCHEEHRLMRETFFTHGFGSTNIIRVIPREIKEKVTEIPRVPLSFY